MTGPTPTTPAAALAEQERVLKLLSNADTPESWYYQPGWGLQKHNADGLGLIAGHSDFATHGDLLLLEAAPTLARQYAALLAAHAEALALLRDCDTELDDLMRRVRRLAEEAPDDDTTDANELRRRIAALPAQAPASAEGANHE